MRRDSVENYHPREWIAIHNVSLPHAGFPLKIKAIQAPNWILAVDLSEEPVLIDIRRVTLTKIDSRYALKFKAVWDASTVKREHLQCEDPQPPVSIPGVSYASYIPPPDLPPRPPEIPYESP